MKTTNTDFEPLVLEVVASILGTRDVHLAAVPTYPDSIVYRATAGGRSVVFKAVDPAGRDPDGIALEAWAMQTAAAQGVPVPEVLAVDTSGAVFPGSHFVMSAVAGVPFDAVGASGAQRVDVTRRVGEVLASLHEVRLRGFGWLVDRAGVVGGKHESWHEALFGEVPAALDYLAEHVTADQHDRLHGRVGALARSAIDPGEPRLLHGDFGVSHVWVDPADPGLAITGVVDFGERASGDWIWDLVEIERRDLGGVLDGYGVAPSDRAGIERRFWEYALVKAVPWAAKWHQRGEPQVLEWLVVALDRAGDGEG